MQFRQRINMQIYQLQLDIEFDNIWDNIFINEVS